MEKVKFFAETLGLSPWGLRFKETLLVLLGDEDIPKAKFGLSSLSQLCPKIGIPLWRGREAVKGKVILSNLFNHTQTPISEGWSVKKTQVLDYRGKQLSYNSHNGTDLAVPIGTEVLTAAPGKIVIVRSDFNRGGLKIFIDHGHGLMTGYAHLARSLVKVGDSVTRGQAIAISGYSGLDGLITFPLGVPHVHFNTWLNGEQVDPFPLAQKGQVSMWVEPNSSAVDSRDSEYITKIFNEEALSHAINVLCTNPKVRDRLNAIADVYFRVFETIFEMNYYPTRFTSKINLYAVTYPRESLIELPFDPKRFTGMVYLDELK